MAGTIQCYQKMKKEFKSYPESILGELPMMVILKGISIGSGSRSSQVKQIGFLVRIASAMWNSGNVPPVFRHCWAYLNGSLF